MKAITVKQPWATLIVKGIKNIENRTWKCPDKYIGERILIHAAAKGWMWIDVLNYLSIGANSVLRTLGYDADWLNQLPTGKIIGSVEIVDCVVNHPSIWAEKSPLCGMGWENGIPSYLIGKDTNVVYNWVLANPIEFETPIPSKGKLSFWDFDVDSDI